MGGYGGEWIAIKIQKTVYNPFTNRKKLFQSTTMNNRFIKRNKKKKMNNITVNEIPFSPNLRLNWKKKKHPEKLKKKKTTKYNSTTRYNNTGLGSISL